MMKKILYLCILLLTAACGSSPELPREFVSLDIYPFIYPDYTDVTVPKNIAPLNFMTTDTVSGGIVAEFVSASGKRFIYRGKTVQIPEKDWKEMLSASSGKDIEVTVYSIHKISGEWAKFKTFPIHIADDEIDEYISYRLIEPGYMLYNKMSIAQRELSSFEEKEIFNNQMTVSGGVGQCINCHSYQNYKTDNMLFHVRVTNGGTVIVVDGKPRKVNLNRENTISAGVYPAWHPSAKLVAFSTDLTHQWFHSSDINKVEVFDDKSDLILYDIESDIILTIAADTTRLEVFPTWSADGRWLYYCSADAWDLNPDVDFRSEYVNLRYNLYRRSFDPATLAFGEEELIYDAKSIGRSVSLPRVSPDNRHIVFAEGNYGYFNIWHKEADIKVLKINYENSDNCEQIDATSLNSENFADSYPSFSSNGRWIMLASRRDDGNYSRVYIAHFDGDKIYKAFLLPQKDPAHNTLRLKSYNRPEFMIEPVKLSPNDFKKIVINH